MKIEIIRKKIPKKRVQKLARESFGDMVKVVIDIKRGIMASGGELHADEEAVLLDDGSKQEDLWGANIYPFKNQQDMIEYTALINIRPSQSNRSMEIENKKIRQKVKKIIEALIK